jgi:hypothetical protein
MFSKCQDCIDELVNLGIQADKERIAELERRLAVAVDALIVAKQNIADWGANATASIQYVHDLKGDIERIDTTIIHIQRKQ